MMYYIFTLKFLTPVHFGDTANGGTLDKIAMACSADTLFAALCNEAAMQGEVAVQQFSDKVAQGRIVLSSLMPYFCDKEHNEDMHFYLPKPLLPAEATPNAARSFQEVKQLATQLKKQKKSAFVRASQMKLLLASMANGKKAELDAEEFAVPFISGKVNLREDKSQPYYVGSYVFADNAGLYLICGAENAEDIDLLTQLLESLGYSGIGGKRSSGYGKFELADDKLEVDEEFYSYDDDKAIAAMLHNSVSDKQLLIAPLLPVSADIDIIKKAGAYKLLKRSGFISSPDMQKNIKRDSIYMLAEGSCFTKRLQGQLLEQRVDGLAHKIYRDGVGMFLGLSGDEDAARNW